MLAISVLTCGGCGGGRRAEERWKQTGTRHAVYDSGIYGGPERVLASPGRLVTNADMKVVCKSKGKIIKQWSGQAQWNGILPDEYVAGVNAGRLVWLGASINPRRVRVNTHADGSGGIALDEWVHPDADELVLTVTPTGAGAGASTVGGGDFARAPASHSEVEQAGGLRKPGGKRGGSPRGIRGGLAPGEGVDSPHARRGGQRRGDPEGDVGGEGSDGDRGVRGAMALFGGLMSVPKAVRPLVEVMLIAEDVNAISLARNWLRQAASGLTVAAMREKLRLEATAYAEARVAKYMPQLKRALNKASPEDVERLVLRLQYALERRYFDKLEEGAAALAAAARERLTKFTRGKQRELWESELARAEALLEVTKVRPIAGRLPVNHKYAGQRVPDEVLPPAYRRQGLRFTQDGYPDFSPHAVHLPNGQKSVKIELTGRHQLDEQIANRAAGLHEGKPKGYTWHHHQDGTTMELVPSALHKEIKHTGGRAHYKDSTGDRSAYGK